MYESKSTSLENGRIEHVSILRSSTYLKYSEVIRLWENDEHFIKFFIGLLADCQFEAFRWETPSLTTQNCDQQFQFVTIDSPGLDSRLPDTQSFAKQLSNCNSENPVMTFDNLGRDATLVVPAGLTDDANYVGIASFTRCAPLAQQLKLWHAVGAAMARKIGHQPIWLSTAGGGVAWLHIRLDSRPKYYSYGPYRHAKQYN